MPVGDRELTGHHGGPAVVTIVQEFHQVPAVLVGQGCEAPGSEDEPLGLGQRRQQLRLAALSFGNGELLEPPGQAQGEHREALAAGLVAKRAGQPGFAHAGGAGEQDVPVGSAPVAWRQAGHEGLLEATWRPRGEVFATGRLAQCGVAPARGEPPRLALGARTVSQEPQAFFDTEGRDLGPVHLLAEGSRHAGQSQRLALVQRGMLQQGRAPLASE
jgi:hypothetical protein